MNFQRSAKSRFFRLALVGLIILPAGILLLRQVKIKRAEANSDRAAAAGDYARAFQELALASAYSTAPESYWSAIGKLAFSAGDPFTAIHYFEKSESLSSLDGEEWTALGDAYLQAGDQLAALNAWENGLEAEGQKQGLLNRLLELHSGMGDYEAVATDLRSLIELDPGNVDLLKEYGLLLAAVEPDKAVPVFALLEESAPESSEIFRELGLSIRRARAVSSDPEYVRLAAGRALAASGNWEMAQVAFEQATEINPGFADAWAYLGAARDRTGLDGWDALQVAYTLDPASLAVNLLIALHLQERGDPEGALAYLQQSREADPENPTLVAEMASIVADDGDITRAIALFEEAISLAPDDPLYWKVMANFSIQNEIQVQEIGLPAARQATLIAPADSEAFDLLGQSYLAIGNLTLAERFLLQAIELDPNFPLARYHLGLLYLTTGASERAKESLETAIRLDPDSPISGLASDLIQTYLD